MKNLSHNAAAIVPPHAGTKHLSLSNSPVGGVPINRKRVQRLMRMMEIETMVLGLGTSKARAGHMIHPYLLRGVAISESNHV